MPVLIWTQFTPQEYVDDKEVREPTAYLFRDHLRERDSFHHQTDHMGIEGRNREGNSFFCFRAPLPGGW